MTLNTLHRFRPLMKLYVDRHFIYITVCRDEHKEQLQSYYKITEEDMDEITKECPAEFLIPVGQAEISDPDLIESHVFTREEYDSPSSRKRRRRKRYRSLTTH
jgi:hypothetical protein